MTKEYAKAYNKAYYQKNKEIEKARTKSYREANKSVVNEKQKDFYYKNKEAIAIKSKKQRESEGVGVYKAVYPSGVYIGSGLIYSRKSEHIKGNSSIARKLSEVALSFEVICLCDTQERALEQEQKAISWYGLDNLLNTYNPKLGE